MCMGVNVRVRSYLSQLGSCHNDIGITHGSATTKASPWDIFGSNTNITGKYVYLKT